MVSVQRLLSGVQVYKDYCQVCKYTKTTIRCAGVKRLQFRCVSVSKGGTKQQQDKGLYST